MNNSKRIKIGLGFTDDRLKTAPPKDKDVFRAMIRNHAYDIQSEGDRSYYAERLFLASSQQAVLAERFREHLYNMPDDLYWGHKEHAIRVGIRLFAGEAVDSEKLIDLIRYHHGVADNYLNTDLLLEFGRTGVIHYLNLHGEAHAVEKWSEYFPSQEKNAALLLQIDELGIGAPDISLHALAFVEDVKHWERDVSPRPPRFNSFADYLDHIQGNWFRGRASTFFRSFTADQMQTVEQRLVTATTDHERAGLLQPIVENGLAGSYRHILPLTSTKNRIVRRLACYALSKVRAKDVRHQALGIITSGKRLNHGIILLGINTEPQDDDLIRTALAKTSSKHKLHDCGYALMANEDVVNRGYLKKSFHYLYFNSRCGVCRASILQQYLDPGELPPEEQQALRFDCFDEIREIQ